MKAKAAVASMLAIGVVLPASGQDMALAPVGEWQVDRSDESCRLWQDFGQGDAAIRFSIYAYGPEGSYRVTLNGPSLPRNTGKARLREVAFGRAGEPQQIIAIDNTSGGEGMVSFHLVGTDPALSYVRGWEVRGGFEAAQPLVRWQEDMSVLHIGGGEMAPVTLELGDLAAPMADLGNCQAALAASWGYNALEPGAVRPVLENRDLVVNTMRMPPAVVVNHITMIAQIRVAVDEQGHATQCLVQHPKLSERAQRDLCRPFSSGEPFAPARNAAGEAVPGLFRMQYTYFIFD